MHTGGEPLRVILNGLPQLEGTNVLEYRRDMMENHDHFRTALMFEPRGHADMYGCVLLPPNDDDADFGIMFLHNEGYSTMCGHAVIAITKLAVEMGWVKITSPTTKVTMDAPCGRIVSFAQVENNQVQSVYFHCVPSFVVALDHVVDVPDYGPVTYDLAYGGAFYAYVDADQHGIDLSRSNVSLVAKLGMDIKRVVIADGAQPIHPFEKDLSFLYGTIFISREQASSCHSKNVCIFAEGEVDRSPTGSGVSGRMAIHHKRNEVKLHEELEIESVIGSRFKGSVKEVVSYGEFDAVIPRVEGTAYITGQHEFVIDPEDPFKQGFLVR